jgi:hypothetical protein
MTNFNCNSTHSLFYLFIFSILGSLSFGQELKDKIPTQKLSSEQVFSIEAENIGEYFNIEEMNGFHNSKMEAYGANSLLVYKIDEHWKAIEIDAHNQPELKNINVNKVKKMKFDKNRNCIAVHSSGLITKSNKDIYFKHIQMWDLKNNIILFSAYTDLSYTPIKGKKGMANRTVKVKGNAIRVSEASYSEKNKEIPKFISSKEYRYELVGDDLVNTI